MKTHETRECNKIIRILSGRSNSYLVLAGNNRVLVDTGPGSSYGRLRRNLGVLKLKISDITDLILTHTHFDHCQSAGRIKKESGCRIIVSEHALEPIKKGYSELPDGTSFFARQIVWLGRKLGKRKFGFETFEPDILVREEYDLSISGISIKVIETPGHSIDSVSVIVDGEVAIVGDAMFGVFRKSVFPPFANDVAKMEGSWRSLLNTGCLVFLPGHGNEIDRDRLERNIRKRAKD